MVVGRYCRTISFPNLTSSKNTLSKPYHVRSTSLPCQRTHPSIPHIKNQISNLISWHRSKPILTSIVTTSSWLVTGLTQLKTVLDSLVHFLQIPLIHDSLSGIENLLEHFLRFLDVYGIFQTSLLSLKNEVAAVQVALRRKDHAKVVAYVKFHKKTVKEMVKLNLTVDRSRPVIDAGDLDQPDEISTIINDVLDLTSSVTTAVLETVVASLGSTRRKTYTWAGFKKVKREDQNDVVEGMEYQLEQLVYKKKGSDDTGRMLEKMQGMEEMIGSLETSSGSVLRSLISTRVSLLNILTHF